MSQSHYPPRFFTKLPPHDQKPHCYFFGFVRVFLKNTKKMNFKKQQNVDFFNRGLTTAIHKDITRERDLFARFREGLESVASAFVSLGKAYTFFDEFERFASESLEQHYNRENFFEYVTAVKYLVNHYVKVKESFRIYEGVLNWPDPQFHTVLNEHPIQWEEKLDNNVNVNALLRPEKNMAILACENFQMANKRIGKEQTAYLQRSGRGLQCWLTKSTCLRHILQSFQTAQAEVMEEFSEVITDYNDDIVELNRMIDENVFQTKRFKTSLEALEQSIDAAHAPITRDAANELQQGQCRMMKRIIVEVYDHALSVLDAFRIHVDSVYSLSVPGDRSFLEEAKHEREKAKAITHKWISELTREKAHLLGINSLPYYLRDLPELYGYIAHFSFINVMQF